MTVCLLLIVALGHCFTCFWGPGRNLPPAPVLGDSFWTQGLPVKPALGAALYPPKGNLVPWLFTIVPCSTAPLRNGTSIPKETRLKLCWRILCSSFLVITCFLIRDCNILPEKELHGSLQVIHCPGLFRSAPICTRQRTACTQRAGNRRPKSSGSKAPEDPK